MAPLRSWLAAGMLLVIGCTAQTITPTNLTTADPQDNNTFLYSQGSHSMLNQDAALLPMTPPARAVPSQGLSGLAFLADTSNQLNVTTSDIVFISCDDSAYPGNIGASAVFVEAVAHDPKAIVFYSEQSDFCNLANAPSTNGYPWVFSVGNANAARLVLDELNASGTDEPTLVIGDAALGQEGSGSTYSTGIQGTGQSQSGDSNSNDNNNNNNNSDDHNPLGPSPSTAVAMIILYSITGIITALFLTIIITGAVRAHRHPERYGPRAMLGMPRQSRAKGLGRAILDTIPIVKVGQRNEQPKTTDVELGDRSAEADIASTREAAGTAATTPEQQTARTSNEATRDHEHDGSPIASAATSSPPTKPEDALESENMQGCSICTEDFLEGQDQRVLPCDHRYHPECIDPWLLNVSSTCPLCRVDLRPPQTEEETEAENARAEGVTVTTEAEQRRSMRRSLMAGVLGIGVGSGRERVERLSREERVAVLRRYRAQVAAGRGTEAGRDGIAPTSESAAAENGRRTRLRNLFSLRGIRTRRTGRDEGPTPASDSQVVGDTVGRTPSPSFPAVT